MPEQRVIIVEGKSDRNRILRILAEDVKVICTNGTISSYHLEEMLAPYDGWEMFVFVDADEDGEKLRKLFKREYPLAIHIYTEKVYREVETTPDNVLAAVLSAAHIKVHTKFLT